MTEAMLVSVGPKELWVRNRADSAAVGLLVPVGGLDGVLLAWSPQPDTQSDTVATNPATIADRTARMCMTFLPSLAGAELTATPEDLPTSVAAGNTSCIR